jgi:hypothetical protein
MEQWHDCEIVEDKWFSLDHHHAEPADECDLALYLDQHATSEDWDMIFGHGNGYYQIRVWANELVMRPVEVKVIDLEAAR